MSDDGDRLDPPPTDEERSQAEELRVDLERSSRRSDLASKFRPGSGGAGDLPSLAGALRAAWEPLDLGVEVHRALVDQALAARRRRVPLRWGSLTRVTFGRTAMVALAASVLLALWRDDSRSPPGLHPALAVSRSTQPLFAEPFAKAGGETARIDRIAMARAADLRENDFAKWGVR